MTKQLKILIHILGSTIFVLITLISNPSWPEISKILSTPHGFRSFIFQLECLALFYLNYYVLIEKYYFTRKYLIYVGIILIFYILFMPVSRAFIDHFFQDYYLTHRNLDLLRRRGPLGLFFSSRTYIFFLVLAFSFLLKLWEHLKAIREQKTVTELSFLKAQINPHFLFNTLNSIYSLSVQNSKDTPQAILRLSSMMRYVLKDTENNFVELNREIDYVRDYISLQELRMDKNVKLQFTIKGEDTGQVIAPLLLIPFIENAFKYGVNAEESSSIEINIDYDHQALTLFVKNSKVTTKYSPGEETKLGLINAKKRLRLLYPKRYDLQIQDNKEDFVLTLKLQFNA
ncbi:MAG: sensor histidine kinase [bacterium]|nr:sensor histidine kinase [bacterium]